MRNITNLILAIFIIALGIFDAYASTVGAAPPAPMSGETIIRNAVNMNKGYFYGDTITGGPFDPVVQSTMWAVYPQPNTPVLVALAKPSLFPTKPNPIRSSPLAMPLNAIQTNLSTALIQWNTLQKGDILIMCDGTNSIADFVSNFSIMTHSAMFYAIDPISGAPQTFESWGTLTMPTGVNIYRTNSYPASEWNKQNIAVAIKRMDMTKVIPTMPVSMGVDMALGKYQNKPFFPSNSSFVVDTMTLGQLWMNKYTYDAFYCSKLVWRTYMDMGVDLDSNRTKSTHLYRVTTGDPSWIGVSPDDIYWSGNTFTIWAKGNFNGNQIYY